MRVKIAFFILLMFACSTFLVANDKLLPPLKFNAKLTSTELIINYSVPNGYYTYIKSPYAKSLSISANDNDYLTFGKAVLPLGYSKGDEVILSGSGEIKIPILSSDMAQADRVSLNVSVSYQLCYATRMVCYSPVSKTLKFDLAVENVDEGSNQSDNEVVDVGNYKGENSGPLVKFSPDDSLFKPVSHLRKNITVDNRVRITVKGIPGSKFGPSVRYFKNGTWVDLKSPWKNLVSNENGTFQLELFFPYVGETHITIYVRTSYKNRNYSKLSYVVTSRSVFKKEDIPVVADARFYTDGFKLSSHKKLHLKANKTMSLNIKGLPNSYLSVSFRNVTGSKSESLYSPWLRHKNVKGDNRITLFFPEKGDYELIVYGKKNRKDKKSAGLYFFYRIKNSQAYSLTDIALQLGKGFKKLGFNENRLSHNKEVINTGRSLKISLQGKANMEILPRLTRVSSGKLFRKAPRVFISSKGGDYEVHNYFPAAGKYELKIYAQPIDFKAKRNNFLLLMKYKINASAGYSLRELDLKMGLYNGEDKYKVRKKVVPKKVEYGSAGDLLWVTDMSEAERISRSQNKIILILHSATWCSYCKKLRKETFRHPELVRYAKDKFVCIEVGGKSINGMALYNRKYKSYKGGTPSVTFISPAGKKLYTRTGYASGKYYITQLKKAIGMYDGSEGRSEASKLANLIRLHKLGKISDSKKLGLYYLKAKKEFKARAVFSSMVDSGKIAHKDLPWYYLTLAYGFSKDRYYKKIINGYSYKIGLYWYQAVYGLAKHYFNWGLYSRDMATKVPINMKKAIDFITPYAENKKYSLVWRTWYYDLIRSFRLQAIKLLKDNK